MTELIAYHHKTCDLALFKSENDFWIGSYDPHLTHQNDQPPYVLIRGYFSSESEGIDCLAQLAGNEF